MWATIDLLPAAPACEPAARLDRARLEDAFELACLVRATSLTPNGGVRVGHPRRPLMPAGMVEFNGEAAARRMGQLMRALDLPHAHETAEAGLRRRYRLHRVSVPGDHRAAYAELTAAAWRQGRAGVLSTAAVGQSAPAHAERLRLAGAAWRAVLLSAGRHMRKHILGVRVTDQDLATVLIRGAYLLGAQASLSPQAGSFLVSVPGPAAHRVLHGAGALPA
ncbi:hypothetical protein [Catellatospora sp. NPDC049609]|uniref:hypothetical protein n=1 Tax=Catellatospora sp. NPDC049609 TaxID=3155505 RepID=UPI00342588E5